MKSWGFKRWKQTRTVRRTVYSERRTGTIFQYPVARFGPNLMQFVNQQGNSDSIG